MYNVVTYIRENGDCPFEQYLATVRRSGANRDVANILAVVNQLRDRGVQGLAQIERAKKMNDVWELRPKPHRIFFFFDPGTQQYVLLHGYRKKSQTAPPAEIARAERLRAEYYLRSR
jgi:phage-related protein